MATPQENPALNTELQRLAQSYVELAATRFGLTLDYSEESLQQTDAVIAKHHAQGQSLEDTLMTHGAYVGETLRRRLGGIWVQDERGVALLEAVGGTHLNASPFSWVQARLTDGTAEALAARFLSLKQQLPAAGAPKLAAPLSFARATTAPAAETSGPTEADMQTITRSPLLVFMLVAAADGKVDKKEMQAFQKVVMTVMSSATPLLRDAMTRLLPKIDEHLQALREAEPSEEVERLAKILDTHFPQEAKQFKEDLIGVAIQIAESSGGFMGFGSKISKDEKEAIGAIAAVLGLIPEGE